MNKTASCELLLFVSGEAGLTLAELSALTEMSKQACQQQIDYLKEKGFQAVPVLEADGEESFSGFRPAELQKLAF